MSEETLSGTRALSKRLFPASASVEMDKFRCLAPRGDQLAWPADDADPYACQLPLARVTPSCHRYCKTSLSDPLECHHECRKWVFMRTPDGVTHSGFALLRKFALNAAKQTLRASRLVPLGYALDRGLLQSWRHVSSDDADIAAEDDWGRDEAGGWLSVIYLWDSPAHQELMRFAVACDIMYFKACVCIFVL